MNPQIRTLSVSRHTHSSARAILFVNMANADAPMDYSVRYEQRNDGETDAALVVRRGAHTMTFSEAAAWTAVKGWLG